MDKNLLEKARAAKGFMPEDEGLALYEAAAAVLLDAPFLEIGSYCGKSAIYLGAAAQERAQTLFCVDHHRGSEENQEGWEHHDSDLVDPKIQKMDTLPFFRRAIFEAGLEESVVAIVGNSLKVASAWNTSLGFLFIDGGHGKIPAHADFDSWSPLVAETGILAIHDVFENPRDGGRPPYEIYCRALESGKFKEASATGSLRILQRL